MSSQYVYLFPIATNSSMKIATFQNKRSQFKCFSAFSSKDSNMWSLSSVKKHQQKQDDAIIHSVIERSKVRVNMDVYQPHPFLGCPYYVRLIREMTAKHKDDGERSFSLSNRGKSPVSAIDYSKEFIILQPSAYNKINVNAEIWESYVDTLLPNISSIDREFISNPHEVHCDLACLEALSQRVHFGTFIAEALYRASPERFQPLIVAQDGKTLMGLFSDESAEKDLKNKLEEKAAESGFFGDSDGRVDPCLLFDFFQKEIVPLTTKVGVNYILQRMY